MPELFSYCFPIVSYCFPIDYLYIFSTYSKNKLY